MFARRHHPITPLTAHLLAAPLTLLAVLATSPCDGLRAYSQDVQTLRIGDPVTSHEALLPCEGTQWRLRVTQRRHQGSWHTADLDARITQGAVVAQGAGLLWLDPAHPVHLELIGERPDACPSLGGHLSAGPVNLHHPTEKVFWIDPGRFEVLSGCEAFGRWTCDSAPSPITQASGSCQVTKAQIRFGPKPDDPLRLPYEYSVPHPGVSDLTARRATGFSNGPVPAADPNHRGLRPTRDWLGAAFEFHADLNNAHGCRSRQEAWAEVTEYEAGRPVKTLPFPLDPAPDGYQGDTRRGRYQLDDAVIYEATPQHIHWLDTPGIRTTRQQPRAPDRSARQRLLLRSTVYDADGRGGWYCVTAHEAWISQRSGHALGGTPVFEFLGCRPFGH